jgi:hypothetical protein
VKPSKGCPKSVASRRDAWTRAVEVENRLQIKAVFRDSAFDHQDTTELWLILMTVMTFSIGIGSLEFVKFERGEGKR